MPRLPAGFLRRGRGGVGALPSAGGMLFLAFFFGAQGLAGAHGFAGRSLGAVSGVGTADDCATGATVASATRAAFIAARNLARRFGSFDMGFS